ncbi:MAG TPA: hypothetical protein VFQ55_11030 [Casimicrobiaceae bacterium]|nr:hypothetical protein [Casimicrobiaceae bacterium]
MNADSREQQKAMGRAYEELRDQARSLDSSHAEPVEKRLAEARDKIVEKAQDEGEPRQHDSDDDIARIERRMEARRESFRQHLAGARDSVTRGTSAWPYVAVGTVIAVAALGYALARQRTPARRFIDRAREAPEAARRYIHRATRPSSAVWTERATKAAGVAVAVARVMPQLRALARAFPSRHRPR